MRDRRCIVLTGAEVDTRREATRLVGAIDPAEVLWIGPGGIAPGRVRRLLGASFDAVVLALYDGLSADVMAQCAGFVRGGGGLIIRLPLAPVPSARLAVEPFTRADVTTHLCRRLRHEFPPTPAPAPLTRPILPASGSNDQRAVVREMVAFFDDPTPRLISLTADRGRGKSSALGMAIAGTARRVVVSADTPAAAAEVFRFALGDPAPPSSGRVCYLPPTALLSGVQAPVLCIDEAARLSVPLLASIVRANPTARIVFATTIRGYEGTGRGFVLRFLAGLSAQPRPVHHLTLQAPIRWGGSDPLEARVFSALAMNAVPADVVGTGPVEHAVLEGERLAADPVLLRDVFGLLVHAHYRTTPEDLHRILDAPNLTCHALLQAGRVVATAIVAAEGGLTLERCAQLARGAGRIRGHALPDTLISHACQTEAGTLEMVRSVRIATHPAMRRRGLASALVAAVHEHHQPALFGTVFGATPSLLRFRRSLGYRLVRVGSARGSRTGEPTAVMIRPASSAAATLVQTLRADLVRELPAQITLMQAEGPLSPALIEAFTAGLPPATAPDAQRMRRRVVSYLHGPCHLEAAIHPLQQAVGMADLSRLSNEERELVAGKVIALRSWASVAAQSGQGIPAVQKGLKRALRRLLE